MNRREFGQLAAGAALGQTFLRGAAQTGPVPEGFRFSVMIWTLERPAPFERCVEMVAAAGYQGIEITGEFQKWTEEERSRNLARVHALGLTIDTLSGMKAGFCDSGGPENFMTQLAAQFEAAKRFESPQINMRSGEKIDGVSPQAQHQMAVDNLKRAAELAAREHIKIVIEPIDALEDPKSYMTGVTEAFEIVREVGSPDVRVLYDFYHEQRGFGNLIEKLEKNIDLVGLVHIADVPGRHEPGTGEIDYRNIYRKLAELKYDRYIAMEFYPTGDPVELLRKARLEAQQAARG
jgi:hydroxypyruvate isomerase